MRAPFFAAGIIASALLLAACNRKQSEEAAVPDAAPAESPAAPSAPQADVTVAPARPIPSDPPQAPAPPAPIVEGMYVIYSCNDGTQPRITFSGNLVKVELTADSAPVILSARASATNTSDMYSDDTLTLLRDGVGITLDVGSTSTRCTESEASA